MFSRIIRFLAATTAVAVFFGLFGLRSRKNVTPAELAEIPGDKMLIFSKTAGFRHGCIPDAAKMLEAQAKELGLVPVISEDAGVFTPDLLKNVKLVVFNNTTGDILNAEQEAAFEAWYRAGGAFVGLHSASDTEYEWKFYGDLIGTYFARHPKVQPATLRVVHTTHPATKHLPAEWPRTDEWYDFKAAPSADFTVLIKLDESSYEGGEMNGEHPIAWCREVHGGRAFYTGLGHTNESYLEPPFRDHVLGGLKWALGRE